MTHEIVISLAAMLALVAGLAWWLFRLVKPAPGRPMVCTQCGHLGPTRPHTKGSTALELVLWLAFIVPGLIYSVWRVSTRRQACTECGSDTLVPEKSPVGRRLRAG